MTAVSNLHLIFRGFRHCESHHLPKRTLSTDNMNSSSLLTPTTSVTTPLSERLRNSYPSQSRNPVAARLYKVLNTKFNDEETGLALQTLSELYATPSPGKASQNGRSFVDEVEVESLPGESAARARKNMRKDMEKKLAEGSGQFLTALGEVDSVSVRKTRRQTVGLIC